MSVQKTDLIWFRRLRPAEVCDAGLMFSGPAEICGAGLVFSGPAEVWDAGLMRWAGGRLRRWAGVWERR